MYGSRDTLPVNNLYNIECNFLINVLISFLIREILMNLNSREASAFYELNGLVECVYGNSAIFTHIL